jgi:Flp pilus assembly protein TadD
MAQSGTAASVQELLRRGQFEAALQAVDRGVAARPGDAEMRFLRAVVLMEMQRDSEALAAFVRLTEDFPELPDPWNNIALLHARAGRAEAARQALETALRNDPSHRTARINLGQVHLMLAAQSWELAASAAPLEPALRQRLEAVRALLQR